jgi:hypothetical protein
MMLRAIETMTWFFHWLSWSEGEAEDPSESYVFFETMRGSQVPRYRSTYRESGVMVLPDRDADDEIWDSEDILWSQYLLTFIVHHQRSVEVARRAVEGAISDDVNQLGQKYGITTITSPDLRALIQGILEYRWNKDAVKNSVL